MQDETKNGARREGRPTYADTAAKIRAAANRPVEPVESMADYWARRDRELAAEQAYISGLMTLMEFLYILAEVL
jgi:hypothetical protein